ncbi:MAG: hypothetical protein EZS28_013994 [Streblomastix strix]|uniref:Uncharacterized protein n=1 Tax=Streblomastix strix TaxID=222440 RepID=A0A5J4W6S7_9EUKA|nr:MAG: hypothetical protein EZS28_013994 [Streblomastix strix]
MSFKSSDYLGRIAKIAHSDYVSGYLQLGEVLKSLSIHPQSFEISKQNFFDSPIAELTSNGVKYTRTPLGARVKSACSMVQTCQVNWTITIPAHTLAIQLNKTYDGWDTTGKLIAPTNFNANEDPLADWTTDMSQAEQALWGSAIYAREQAVISGNSLSNSYIKNTVIVSPLENIIEGKCHCGVFIDIPLCEIDRQIAAGTTFYFRIPNDITFSGVLDLNQLNSIFNSFPVLTPYHMIPPEKPDIVYLLSGDDTDELHGFDKNSGSMQSIISFSNIKSLFMTFAMPQYPTWFFPVLFIGLNLVIDQNNVILQPYKSLNQATNGQMFDCFADQDVVSAPSDLYLSLTFENLNIDDKNNYQGLVDNAEQYKTANIFYLTTLFSGSKAAKTLYPNKYMLAWKLTIDDSFMRGFNSSKLDARTNIYVILQENLTKEIIDTTNINPSQKQNDFKQFIGTRAYPDPIKASITPMMHYLCDAFVRIIFDDSSMPQVLNIDVIGELAKGAIQPQ